MGKKQSLQLLDVKLFFYFHFFFLSFDHFFFQAKKMKCAIVLFVCIAVASAIPSKFIQTKKNAKRFLDEIQQGRSDCTSPTCIFTPGYQRKVRGINDGSLDKRSHGLLDNLLRPPPPEEDIMESLATATSSRRRRDTAKPFETWICVKQPRSCTEADPQPGKLQKSWVPAKCCRRCCHPDKHICVRTKSCAGQ